MTLLTVGDVARMCQLSKSKIYDLKDKITYLKVGGSVRFTEADVLRYLDECRVENGQEPKRATVGRLRHLKA